MASPVTGPTQRDRREAILLLASSSPRRRELLASLDVPFEVAAGVSFQELTERENRVLSPSEFVWYNALGKALAAAHRFPAHPILAADTVVSLGARILGKPADRAEADAGLAVLSGRTHLVQTALILVTASGRVEGGIERTRVTFKTLSPAARKRYLDKVEVLDKAGGYAIQQHGDWLAEKIEGSLSNVIGLPLERLSALLTLK